MQIVKAMGGLGNQMFAYAFALALRKLGREVSLDTSWHDRNEAHNGWELDRVFAIDIPICANEERDRLGDLDTSNASRLRRKILGPRKGHFREGGDGYDGRYLKIGGDAYFEGFWQSPLYHAGIEAEIEAAFRFPEALEEKGRGCLEAAAGRSLIGVHVRRGDYLRSDFLGGVCTEEYFLRAIELLLIGATDPLLLFFSDDLEWCERTLAKGLDAVFVDWNRGRDSWRDLRLMTRCDRLAISNSSFSWWGARLGAGCGTAERKIVAPSRWYGARHPDNTAIALPGWIRLDSRGQR